MPAISNVLDDLGRRTLGVVLVLTGASALTLQVAWQRIIAMHSGVDLSSSTTVIAAFLGGMGLGSLLGGRLADRLEPRAALRALAAAHSGVGLFALVSPWLLYDLYASLAGPLDSVPATFAYNVVLLVVPTTLMGMGLPLVARAVVADPATTGGRMGRLGAANTAGAAFGALFGGGLLVGRFGLDTTTAIAGIGDLVAAGAIVALSRRAGTTAPLRPGREPAGLGAEPGDHEPRRETLAWYLLYGASGFVALGLEVAFIRLVDAIMRSNSYTFGQVLFIYLSLWALGAAAGARLLKRGLDPRAAVPWLLFLVGAGAVGSLLAVTEVLPALGFDDRIDAWFRSDGFAAGPLAGDLGDQILFAVVMPGLAMAVPVLAAGALFPVMQSLVSRRLGSVGRAVGRLTFANLAGNVAGTLVVGFVLIDRLGTAGTFVALSVPAMAAPLLAALLRRGPAVSPRLRWPAPAVASVAAVALVAATPTNTELWARLHAQEAEGFAVAETRACASALRTQPDGAVELTINAVSQNGYPFDDFHLLIGLLPALAHPRPRQGLAIGLGIGSTSWGMLASGRMDRVTTVELCAGHYELIDRIIRDGATDLRLLTDPVRHRGLVGDGRKYLLVHDEARYDLIVPDTNRTSSAGSGNLMSREFLELLRSRLAPGGTVAIWAATNRIRNAVATTYPYSVEIDVPSYNSTFLVASEQPLDLDPEVLVRRLDAIAPGLIRPAQQEAVRSLLADLRPRCLTDGGVGADPAPEDENRDLHPRDEYFISNEATPDDRVSRNC